MRNVSKSMYELRYKDFPTDDNLHFLFGCTQTGYLYLGRLKIQHILVANHSCCCPMILCSLDAHKLPSHAKKQDVDRLKLYFES